MRQPVARDSLCTNNPRTRTCITGERDPEVCAELGLRRIEVSHFWLGGKRLKNVIKEHPEYLQVDFDGNRSQTYLSPAYLLDEAWPYFEEHLRETVLRYKPETLLYDIETNPWTGYFASYDERSLREFAEFAQVAAAGLTPQVIKEHHSEKWLAFAAQRCAQVCRKTKDAIHNILPGTELLVYSGYQSPDTLASLSVDWARIAALDAVDAACCGYGRNPKNLNATRKALGDIPLVTGALLSPYVVSEDRPLNYYSKAGLLRRLIDGTGGVLLYERLSFDGRCYEAVAEVSRLSADYEEIFLHGKLLEHWGDFGEAVMGDSAVLEHNGKHLIAIMNEHGQPGTYRFKLPETGFTKGTEYYSGQRVVPGQPIELQLEPGGVAAYVLE